MWSDLVLESERLHTLRLFFWAATAVVVGTALLVVVVTQGRGSALLRRFGTICAALGVAELILAAISYRRLTLRNLAGTTRLDRLGWLQLGLYLGMAGIGVATAVVARSVAPRAGGTREVALASVGGGIAITLHGLALATLELLLLASISR